MSLDMVALVAEQPDPGSMLAGLSGPRGMLGVRHDATTGVTHIHDPEGPLLVSVEAPALVQVEGEVQRLLGVEVAGPVWWIDIRAAVEPDEAFILARTIADEFVRRHGGVLWTGTQT